MPRYFTRDSAEALLPRIEPLLREMQALRAEQPTSSQRRAELGERVKRNGHLPHASTGDASATATQVREHIEARLEQINALGVLVKDLDAGLIDFPTLRDGHEVYLCWRLGEGEHIQWWHAIEDGFAGRQLLDPGA
jgi:hypothetical protein